MPSQIKARSFEPRQNLFYPYATCKCVLGCYVASSLISTQTFWGSLTASVDRDKKFPFSAVTISDIVWRKVPESEAWGVPVRLTGCWTPRTCHSVQLVILLAKFVLSGFYFYFHFTRQTKDVVQSDGPRMRNMLIQVWPLWHEIDLCNFFKKKTSQLKE